jgi:hypothetical protein
MEWNGMASIHQNHGRNQCRRNIFYDSPISFLRFPLYSHMNNTYCMNAAYRMIRKKFVLERKQVLRWDLMTGLIRSMCHRSRNYPTSRSLWEIEQPRKILYYTWCAAEHRLLRISCQDTLLRPGDRRNYLPHSCWYILTVHAILFMCPRRDTGKCYVPAVQHHACQSRSRLSSNLRTNHVRTVRCALIRYSK